MSFDPTGPVLQEYKETTGLEPDVVESARSTTYDS
jgi:hypothetical protein